MELVGFFMYFAFAVHNAAGSSIEVVPATHQFRARNFTGNVTFVCNVTGENPSAGRDAVWAVQQRQIQNQEDTVIRRSFADIGIFVEVLQPGVTALVITSEARLSYFRESPPTPNITVMCAAFTNSSLPLGEEGQQINVTTFGWLVSST